MVQRDMDLLGLLLLLHVSIAIVVPQVDLCGKRDAALRTRERVALDVLLLGIDAMTALLAQRLFHHSSVS